MAEGWARAFAPATVSNVTCGFDLLGFAIEEPGDTVTASLSGPPGVRVVDVRGDSGRLPRAASENTAGVAVRALLREHGLADEVGVELELDKGLPLASGLGSSAASAAAAVTAVDALLGLGSTRERLLLCAVEAERVACGAAHADNAAPALYGGLVLVRNGSSLRVDPLQVPERLFCAVAHPHLEIRTEAARSVLPEEVSRRDAITQAGNLAALVAGLATDDLELVASALFDVIAEPGRIGAVPGFEAARRAALEAGALGVGLSGSGPSIFALTEGRERAAAVARATAAAILDATGVASDVYESRVGASGARLVADAAR